jgi:septal ring factor EnvC (AmiA/AmiB activator)
MLRSQTPLPSVAGRQPLTILLIAAALLLPAGNGWASEIGERQQQLESLRDRISSMQRKLEEAREEYDDAEKDLVRVERLIAATAAELRKVEQRIDDQKERLAELERAHSGQQQALAQERTQLALQLRAVHAAGHQHRIKLLLNQQDPTVAGRMMILHDYYQRARSAGIEAISGQLKRLAASREAVEAERQRLQLSRSELASKGSQLATQRSERDRLVVTLRGRVTAHDNELKRLRADEKRLTNLIESIRSALARIPPEPPPARVDKRPFRKLRGELRWPTRGRLEIGFGATRQLGDFHWQGMVIAAPEGQEVQAVARGRVAYADWLRGYGMLLIIDHGGGYLTLYGYNRSLYRAVGDWVEAGSAIAQVGVSGGRERSALYFELRRNGQPVDPIRWLTARRR